MPAGKTSVCRKWTFTGDNWHAILRPVLRYRSLNVTRNLVTAEIPVVSSGVSAEKDPEERPSRFPQADPASAPQLA